MRPANQVQGKFRNTIRFELDLNFSAAVNFIGFIAEGQLKFIMKHINIWIARVGIREHERTHKKDKNKQNDPEFHYTFSFVRYMAGKTFDNK